jgi:hypothetical protein
MSDQTTATAAPAKAKAKKPALPAVEHVFDTRDSLEAGVADAKAKGYEKFATRKFEVRANGKTCYVMAYNVKDGSGRAAGSGKLGIDCKEIDPSPRTAKPVAPTADAVMSAMSMLSPEDQAKIKAALLKAESDAKKVAKK